MKKVKRKGFTAIELLTVIIIAIVVVISIIPLVICIRDRVKEKQLQNSANIVGEWLNKQYLLAGVHDEDSLSEEYKEYISTGLIPEGINEPITPKQLNDKILEASGVVAKTSRLSNFSENSNVWYNKEKKKMCIKLIVNNSSDYYVEGSTNTVYSNGCP